MTESTDPTAVPEPVAPDSVAAPPPYSAPAPTGGVPAPAMAVSPLAPMAGPTDGPLGKVRGTGACILLTIVTFGIYSLYWFYKTHDEMKRHTGSGVGGGIAFILAFFVGIVMWFLTPNEVGGLYERKGMKRPVGAGTGLWILLLGWFFLIGAIVWFVKTNGALNAYWRTQGAQG